MKAITYYKYGSTDNLNLEEVAKPTPKENEVLVKVHAASVNLSDWEGLTGSPFYARFAGLLKPGNPFLGSDIAGKVEATGSKVTQFKPGDEVFGLMWTYHGGLQNTPARLESY